MCLQVLGRITAFVKKKKKVASNSNLQNYLWDKYLSHVFEKSGENYMQSLL